MSTEDLLYKLGRVSSLEPMPEGACLSSEQLEAFRAGVLPDSEHEAVERHLSSCPVCLDLLLCLDLEVPSLSEEAVARVLAATGAVTTASGRETTEPGNVTTESGLIGHTLTGDVADGAAPGVGAAVSRPDEPMRGDNVLPFRAVDRERRRAGAGRRVTSLRWAAPLIAAAAAMILWIMPRQPTGHVPPYDLALSGQVVEMRGASVEPSGPAAEPAGQLPIFIPDSDLVMKAVPVQGQPSALPAMVAYLRQPDGAYLPFEPPPHLETDAASGLVELRARAGELLKDRYGPHKVRVLLLPAGSAAPGRLAAGPVELEGGQVLEAVFDYRPSR